MTPVKNQKSLRFCWTLVVGRFEGHYAIQTGGLKRFLLNKNSWTVPMFPNENEMDVKVVLARRHGPEDPASP